MSGPSVSTIFLANTIIRALISAENNTASAASSTIPAGLTIASTPTNPTKVASQRPTRIASPSSSIASSSRNSGRVNSTAVASASAMCTTAK